MAVKLWQLLQSDKVYKLTKKELGVLEQFMTLGQESIDETMKIIVDHGEQMPNKVLEELKQMFKDRDKERQRILSKTGGRINKKNYIFLGESYEAVKLMMSIFHKECLTTVSRARSASVDAVCSQEKSSRTQKVHFEHDEKPKQGAPYYSACTFQVNTKNAFAGAHDFSMEQPSFVDSATSNSTEDSCIVLDERLLSKDGVGAIPHVDSPPDVTKKLSTDSRIDCSAPESNPDSDTNDADDTPFYISFASLSLKHDDDAISLASYHTCLERIPESQEEGNSMRLEQSTG